MNNQHHLVLILHRFPKLDQQSYEKCEKHKVFAMNMEHQQEMIRTNKLLYGKNLTGYKDLNIFDVTLKYRPRF